MDSLTRCNGVCSASGRYGAVGKVAPRLQANRRPFDDSRQQAVGARGTPAATGLRQRQPAHGARQLPAAPRIRWTIAAAAAPPTPAAAAATSAAPASEPPVKSAERGQRLESMVQLRKLYRNLLRAEALVEQPAPVYQAAAEAAAAASATAASAAPGAAPAAAASEEQQLAASTAAADEAQRRLDEAVEIVGEMELTAEQMKVGLRALRSLPYNSSRLFRPDEQANAAAALEERVNSLFAVLAARAGEEMKELPFPTETAAHAAIDARNAQYRLSVPWNPAEGGGQGEGGLGAAGDPDRPGLSERLVKAEKAAEQFVARRVKPAVQRVKETSPEGVVEGLKSSAVWAKGVWNRLNGTPGQPFGRDAPLGLPLPIPTEDARKLQQIQQLNVQLDGLEKKLQEASKARETRLRKAGIQGRARMASELRDMDNDIAALSKALAVRTLQLEMEYVHGALEEEALDIVGDSKGGDLKLALSRRGSSDEVALLVAEFRLLDEQLGGMAAAVESEDALFIDDNELARLASDIPDLRVRLGIGDTEVFGGQGFSLVKVQMQIREGVVKVVDGVLFGVRGVKLLFNDIGSAGKLFWRAVRGGTLKPREVQALRRTIRDVLTFVPFTIILIIPLTPVGHVLIFGFIQRYFPGFFPSQFTGRRQDLMRKYEELKQQLKTAELQAEAENDEKEYRLKAASAMAVLGRGAAVAVAGGAPAAAAAAAAASVLGGELEVAAAVGAAAAAAAAASMANNGGGSRGSGSSSSSDEEEEEGPAAKAVRQIEKKLVAAEDDAYIGDVGEQPQQQQKPGGPPGTH